MPIRKINIYRVAAKRIAFASEQGIATDRSVALDKRLRVISVKRVPLQCICAFKS